MIRKGERRRIGNKGRERGVTKHCEVGGGEAGGTWAILVGGGLSNVLCRKEKEEADLKRKLKAENEGLWERGCMRGGGGKVGEKKKG